MRDRNRRVRVLLYDDNKCDFVREQLFDNTTPSKAIETFILTLGLTIDSTKIYKSNVVSDRRYYDINDAQIVYAQYA